jgi:CRP/FNR family transcriptional regulator, cyclic AMP receptor protein
VTAQPQIARALKAAQLFAGLSEKEFAVLSARALRKLYAPGELLFVEGEPCQGFYIVVRGRVRIYKTSGGGREQVLAVEGPGSSIAELPVFDGGAYPASAAALEDTEMVFISRKDFHLFCRQHPDVALQVLAVVGARLRRLVGIIEELSFTTVRQRLIAFLLRESADKGKLKGNIAEFEIEGSHHDLAQQIGTVRELVSRNLTRLQAEGLIEIDGRKLLIKDVKELAAIQALEKS